MLYCYSKDGIEFSGEYPTEEEAIKVCEETFGFENGDIYYIGEIVVFTPRNFISVFSILEQMNTQATFELGKEVVGDWPKLNDNQYHQLREILGDFFEEQTPAEFKSVQNKKPVMYPHKEQKL